MRDLQGYRTYVYEYLDLAEDDIPTSLIDAWVLDGYRRIIKAIRRWPHFEMVAELHTEGGVDEYELPAGMENLQAIESPWGMLEHVDYAEGHGRFHLFSGTVPRGRARAWSLHRNRLRIWPQPDGSERLVLIGWRAPRDWMAEGAGAVPDFPEAFEDALLSWVLYRALIHQDEIELATIHKADHDERLDELISHEIQKPSAFPLILHGGGSKRPSLPMRQPYPWEGWR